MFYVRFIRPRYREEHEVLCAGDMEETAIPRQGEWVHLKVSEDLTIHSRVEKVTGHYVKVGATCIDRKSFTIDHYEIIVA